jgi:hypothetical protein
VRGRIGGSRRVDRVHARHGGNRRRRELADSTPTSVRVQDPIHREPDLPLRGREECGARVASICARGVQVCLGVAPGAGQHRRRENVKKALAVALIVGFLLVDFLFFHDIFKAGEAVTFAQYLTGLLSIPVLVVSALYLLRGNGTVQK